MHFTKLPILFIFIYLTNCFVIHDQNNLALKKDPRHMNDDGFRDVEYDMIKREKRILDKGTEAKMLSGKVYNTEKNIAINHQYLPNDLALKTTVVSCDTVKHSDYKFEYNYNDLAQEYYLQSGEESRSKNNHMKENESERNILETFQKLLFLNQLTSNCTEEETRGFGVKALKYILQDYRNKRRSLKETTAKLWRIVKIWFILYFAVALPVWFTGGWCCCCLCCKIFKPHKTIDEARNYLLTNPPGIFKDKYGETHYIPLEKEKEKYEEFEHLLRTI